MTAEEVENRRGENLKKNKHQENSQGRATARRTHAEEESIVKLGRDQITVKNILETINKGRKTQRQKEDRWDTEMIKDTGKSRKA